MSDPITQLAWVFVFFALVTAAVTSAPLMRGRTHPVLIPALYFGTGLTAFFLAASIVLFYAAYH